MKNDFYKDEEKKAKQINQLFKKEIKRWIKKIPSSQYTNPPKQEIGEGEEAEKKEGR